MNRTSKTRAISLVMAARSAWPAAVMGNQPAPDRAEAPPAAAGPAAAGRAHRRPDRLADGRVGAGSGSGGATSGGTGGGGTDPTTIGGASLAGGIKPLFDMTTTLEPEIHYETTDSGGRWFALTSRQAEHERQPQQQRRFTRIARFKDLHIETGSGHLRAVGERAIDRDRCVCGPLPRG